MHRTNLVFGAMSSGRKGKNKGLSAFPTSIHNSCQDVERKSSPTAAVLIPSVLGALLASLAYLLLNILTGGLNLAYGPSLQSLSKNAQAVPEELAVALLHRRRRHRRASVLLRQC